MKIKNAFYAILYKILLIKEMEFKTLDLLSTKNYKNLKIFK